MTIPPIVLAIATKGVGGAEKRLCEVWLHLALRLPNLRMLVRRSTFDQLCQRPDLAALQDFRDRITTVETSAISYPATMAAFVPELWKLPRGSLVHHILQAPPLVHRLCGHRLLVSWVGTTFPRLREKPADWAVSTMSLRAADVIDVLNPEILAQLEREPQLKPKLRLTAGGTFVDFEQFRPASPKLVEIVFLGTLIEIKGILEFAAALPTIAKHLRVLGLEPRFRIFGNEGNASDRLSAYLASPENRDIDVEIGTTEQPAEILATAKIFVSLQRTSNYPSKALAEAMACGCVPIITDVGDSRLMADPQAATFIKADWRTEELARAIADILVLPADQFAERSKACRASARQRFTSASQTAYYEGVYSGLVANSTQNGN